MSLLKLGLTELWALFVDDGALALGLLAWCGLVGLGFRWLALPDASGAPILAFGCLAILVGTVFRAARRR